MSNKAIALCRVSTKGQELDGNLEPQKVNVQKAADLLEVELVKVWAVAVSSRKGKNVKRKDLREMHDYCKRYKSVKYIIIDEVDRFMRSIKEYYWWKVEFEQVGVEIRLASNPLIDPEEDRAIFDELIDVYRAEQSNNERIKKTPEKQKARIIAGYYPSNPHTGYRKSDIPGLHIPDEPNWSAMRDTFKEMISGECDIKEGLKRATERGLRTKNYGPKAVGGRTIDMYRWKELMCEEYFAGIIRFSDWDIVNESGLHVAMITKDEHEILKRIAHNKGKRFVINRDNPEFPFSNEAECLRCVLSNNPYPRLVGYWQSNGEKKGWKKYRRYRCRDCNLGLRQEELHAQVHQEFEELNLNNEQKEKLKKHCRTIWRTYEQSRIEKAKVALGNVSLLQEKKRVQIQSLATNPALADDITEEINRLKGEIEAAQRIATEAQDFEKDFDEFIGFAFDYMGSLSTNWWEADKHTQKVCKQIIFPSGIQLTPDKKVYIPEISIIYRYGTNKTDPEGSEIMSMEGPVILF